METQIKLEDLSSIQKKFIVTIPAERVGKTVEKKFAEIQRTAKLKGFRPGHVPINLVKQYYADDVKHRVLHSLIDEGYREALKKHPLRVVGEPKVEGATDPEHLHIHDGEDLAFSATVDIVPEVEAKDYKGLKVDKEKVEVSAEDFLKAKSAVLDRKAELVPVTRAVRIGDFVDFKYDGQVKTEQGWESKAELSGERFLELGSGQLLPEFEKGIVGGKPGETNSFEFDYPSEYSEQSLAGKKAKYDVSIREVKEKRLPDFTDELAKEFGYESYSDFEAKTTDYLKTSKQESNESKFRNDLMQKLVDKNPFEVPQSLVLQQVRAIADDYAAELRRYGFNDQMIQNAVISQLEDFKKRADTQVKAGILLDSIARKEKVTPTQQDLDRELTLTAQAMGISNQELKQRLDRSVREKSNFEFRVREELTIQLVTQNAKITEVKAKQA